MQHKILTRRIIRAFYKVYNTLGYGFLEKVYEKSLLIELKTQGLVCTSQSPIKVYYNDLNVGVYYADIIVEALIILELKASEGISEEHEFQLINYLKATDLEIGLLLNFGKTPQFKRKIFTNNPKNIYEDS